MDFNPLVLGAVAVGLVVLALAVNAMFRKNAGKSNANVDNLEDKISAKWEEIEAKIDEKMMK